MVKFNQIIKVLGLVFLLSINSFAGEKEVTDFVNQFLDNAKGGNISAVEDLISEDADFIRINNIINEKLTQGKGDFLDLVKSGKYCSWASSTDIKVIDVQDDIAVACVEYQNSKLVQKEYLTLVLNKDQWEIVNSVCSLTKK